MHGLPTDTAAQPSPDEVRHALERVLGSPEFATAGRHSRLLRYLVERTLAGEGDQLKEYVLGTEVFDRPASYDPRVDTIVRVEARRLRKRLEEYYRSTGAADPVAITLRPGSYVPSFAARHLPTAAGTGVADREASSATAPETGEPGVPVTVRSRHAFSRPAILAATAAAVVLAAAGIRLVLSGSSTITQASQGPAIAVLPFEHYTTSAEDAALAARITDAFSTGIARLGTLAVASRTSATQYSSVGRSLPAIAAALNVDFVLEGTATISGSTVRLQVRLVDARLDRKVWVVEHVVRTAELPDRIPAIAAEASAAALNYRRPG